MKNSKLVRVTRTVRQTYYIVVEGAPSNAVAANYAAQYVDENIGESGDPLTDVTEWVGQSRTLSAVEPAQPHAVTTYQDEARS